MYCKNCGNKNDITHKYCGKCGHPNKTLSTVSPINITPTKKFDERWWHRLLKVFYILSYIQILWITPVVWNINSTNTKIDYYDGKFHYQYIDTTWEAFWYSALTIIIFIVVLRLIKFSVLYIILAKKPIWQDEIKKLF